MEVVRRDKLGAERPDPQDFRVRQLRAEMFNYHAAGDIPCRVSAHAVRDQAHTGPIEVMQRGPGLSGRLVHQARAHRDAVLIDITSPADVRQRGHAQNRSTGGIHGCVLVQPRILLPAPRAAAARTG